MQYILNFFFDSLSAICNAFDTEIILFTSIFAILLILQFLVRFFRNAI